jgi:2-oxoglutarate ferredoxin oxidoreductase subunit alpha
MRLRGFPFQDEVRQFIQDHETIFVIEQNRDSQIKTLLVNECGTCPDKLFPITAIDAMPVTAGHISKSIAAALTSPELKASPLQGGAR